MLIKLWTTIDKFFFKENKKIPESYPNFILLNFRVILTYLSNRKAGTYKGVEVLFLFSTAPTKNKTKKIIYIYMFAF